MHFDQAIVARLQAERSRQLGRRVGRRWLPDPRALRSIDRREGEAGRLTPTLRPSPMRLRHP